MNYLNLKGKLTFYILVISAFCSFIHGQNSFVPGFYLENDGDTIVCEINEQSFNRLANSCKFRLPNTNETVTFTPSEIKGFEFLNGDRYESKELLGMNLFLSVLVKGRINLYTQNIYNETELIIEKEGQPLSVLIYEEGVKYDENDEPHYIQSKKHLGILFLFMQDGSGKIKRKINTIIQPTRKNVSKLVAAYNSEFSEHTDNISYVSKSKEIDFYVQPIFNFRKYNVSPKYVSGYGILFGFTFTQHDQFQINIGILNAQKSNFIKRNNINYTLNHTTIPLQIQYSYPFDNLKVYGLIGTSIFEITTNPQSGRSQTPLFYAISLRGLYSFATGIKVDLSQKIEFTTGIEYSTIVKKALITDDIPRLNYYSLNMGLIYHF